MKTITMTYTFDPDRVHEVAQVGFAGPEMVIGSVPESWIKAEVELFHLITLDARHRPIKKHMISRGTVSSSLVHPREVFIEAIRDRASAIVVLHNHPSDDARPSVEDIELTRRLSQCGQLLGVPLLDHIILVSERKNCRSMREECDDVFSE